jgi:hypothetical protein
MSNDLSEAKQTLLRALEAIEEVEEETGGTVWALAVCYSVTKKHDNGDISEDGGWVSTGEPSWVTSAMMRRAADYIDASVYIGDPEDE